MERVPGDEESEEEGTETETESETETEEGGAEEAEGALHREDLQQS
jgi:hypothetical protein